MNPWDPFWTPPTRAFAAGVAIGMAAWEFVSNARLDVPWWLFTIYVVGGSVLYFHTEVKYRKRQEDECDESQ